MDLWSNSKFVSSKIYFLAKIIFRQSACKENNAIFQDNCYFFNEDQLESLLRYLRPSEGSPLVCWTSSGETSRRSTWLRISLTFCVIRPLSSASLTIHFSSSDSFITSRWARTPSCGSPPENYANSSSFFSSNSSNISYELRFQFLLRFYINRRRDQVRGGLIFNVHYFNIKDKTKFWYYTSFEISLSSNIALYVHRNYTSDNVELCTWFPQLVWSSDCTWRMRP